LVAEALGGSFPAIWLMRLIRKSIDDAQSYRVEGKAGCNTSVTVEVRVFGQSGAEKKFEKLGSLFSWNCSPL